MYRTVLTALLLAFGSALAQTDHHQSGTDDQHENEQHSEHEMNHDMHNMGGEQDAEAQVNTVAVGESLLTVVPLLDDGTLKLALESDMGEEPAAERLELFMTSPTGETRRLEFQTVTPTADTSTGGAETDGTDEQHHEGENVEHGAAIRVVAELPAFEEGIWRVEGTLGEREVAFPLAMYRAERDTTEIYALFAPAPTLSGRGLSEAFVYAFREGEPVHNTVTLRREMAGMQHSADDDVITLRHEYFGNLYDTSRFEPMANRAPLSFAMVGTWTVDVTVGEVPVTLEVEVLGE